MSNKTHQDYLAPQASKHLKLLYLNQQEIKELVAFMESITTYPSRDSNHKILE
ncbi:MAG: hypothetical protein ACPGUD_07500 [Parashewanella sp.]